MRDMTPGEKLRAWREAQKPKISAASIAKDLNVTQPSISRIERGRQRPEWKLARAIEALTKGAVTAEELYCQEKVAA